MSTTTRSPLTGDSFHNITLEKSLRVLDSALESDLISPTDYGLIKEFVDEKAATAHITMSRHRKIISQLTQWRRFLENEYTACTATDLTTAITALKIATSLRGGPYSQDSIADYIRSLKMFFTWLIDEEYSDIPEKKIRRIKAPKISRSRYSEEDVFTLDQIKTIVNKGCKDLKELAMFTLQYEGALRIGEIGTLTWDQVEFHPTHVNLYVEFKTEYPRQVPIVLYREYIQMWRNMHDPVPGAPVFLDERRKAFEYGAIRKKWRKIGERADISSTISPHLVRHTRITHMILEGYSKESVGLICYGRINAPELDRYAHLFGAVDDMILKHHGIVRADTKVNGLQMVQCKGCGYVNPPGKMYCFSCNTPLNDVAQEELTKFKAEMSPDKIMKIITAEIEKERNVTAH